MLHQLVLHFCNKTNLVLIILPEQTGSTFPCSMRWRGLGCSLIFALSIKLCCWCPSSDLLHVWSTKPVIGDVELKRIAAWLCEPSQLRCSCSWSMTVSTLLLVLSAMETSRSSLVVRCADIFSWFGKSILQLFDLIPRMGFVCYRFFHLPSSRSLMVVTLSGTLDTTTLHSNCLETSLTWTVIRPTQILIPIWISRCGLVVETLSY